MHVVCFAVSVVLVGPFKGGFTSSGVSFPVIKIMNRSTYVHRRAYMSAFNSFFESITGVTRATSRPGSRFKDEEGLQMERHGLARFFQMGVVVSRCFAYKEDYCHVHRVVGAFRYVRVRATSCIYFNCRLVHGFFMAIMRRGIFATQRPPGRVKRDVKGSCICYLFL